MRPPPRYPAISSDAFVDPTPWATAGPERATSAILDPEHAKLKFSLN